AEIDSRYRCRRASITNTGEVAEVSQPCRFGIGGLGDRILRHFALVIDENKEERFVLDDRTADPTAELIPVQNISRVSPEIVEPRVCSQGGVSILFENAAVEFICARSYQDLHLTRTAAKLSIRRRNNNSNLLNQIKANINNKVHTLIDVLFHHIDS